VPLFLRLYGRNVLAQDRLFETLELLARLEPHPLVEIRARVSIRVERFGLAAGAVEGEHQLVPEALAIGVLCTSDSSSSTSSPLRPS